ncbi:MAG: hypothetical protein HRT99_03355 [Mycoplasmatales bacterium]|nr:hypothetical protein [Mycoplasmatales bacterium]
MKKKILAGTVIAAAVMTPIISVIISGIEKQKESNDFKVEIQKINGLNNEISNEYKNSYQVTYDTSKDNATKSAIEESFNKMIYKSDKDKSNDEKMNFMSKWDHEFNSKKNGKYSLRIKSDNYNDLVLTVIVKGNMVANININQNFNNVNGKISFIETNNYELSYIKTSDTATAKEIENDFIKKISKSTYDKNNPIFTGSWNKVFDRTKEGEYILNFNSDEYEEITLKIHVKSQS